MADVIINEVRTQGANGASDEFIELLNTTGTAIDIGGWRIVYRSAAGTSDVAVATIPLGTMIKPGGFYLLANANYAGASLSDQQYTAGLAAAAGGLQLRNGAGTAIDSVGYGTATNAFVEGSAAPAPSITQSITRTNGVDTNNNFADFTASTGQTPSNSGRTIQFQTVTRVLNEGSAGTTNAFEFTVVRSNVTGVATIGYTIAGSGANPATADDFVGGAAALTGSVQFADGSNTAVISVPVFADTAAELDESFTVTLGSPPATYMLDAQTTATGTIVNDDITSDTISVTTATLTQAEGDTGTTAFAFTLTRTGSTAAVATVNFAVTAAGGVTTLDGTDFAGGTLPAGTATFDAGSITATVTIIVAADRTIEPTESFLLTLSSPSAGYAVNTTAASGTGTITNDDAAGTVSVADVSVGEGGGNAVVTFTRTDGTGDASVFFTTVDGTATAGSDYTANSGTATFAAGATSAQVLVTLANDALAESNETFTLTLTPGVGGPTLANGSATVTILDDDFLVSVADVTVNEGAGTATVTLTRNSGSGDVTIGYATANGTATAGSDYAATSGTASFIGAATSATFTIPISDDVQPEANETIAVDLSVASGNATLARPGATVTITDNDGIVIPGGDYATSYTAGTATTYTLLAGTTRTVTAGVTGVTVATNGATIDIEGTLQGFQGSRAIDGNPASVTGAGVLVGASGLVSAVNADGVRFRAPTGGATITNLGQIVVTSNNAAPTDAGANMGTNVNLGNGHAVNITAMQGAAGASATDYTSGGTVTNGSTTNATALIRSSAGDAVRLGSHQTLLNYGTIDGSGVVNDTSANNALRQNGNTSTLEPYGISRGVRIDNDTNATTGPNQGKSVRIDNYGTIAGAQHGIDFGDADSADSLVINEIGGTIVGRNGSGVGADTTGAAASTITVINSGVIRGERAAVVIDRAGYTYTNGTGDSDGDGVDIDGGATIANNVGASIIGAGAGGFDSNGRANASEGISIGGGVIVNAGVISGADAGIVTNNDANATGSRSGVAATAITNQAGGTITGGAGYAIRLENKTGTAIDNDTITNFGTITGNGTIPTGIVNRQNGVADTGTVGTLDGTTYTAADAGNARFIRGDGAAIQMGEGADTLANYGTITGNSGRAVNLEGGADALTLFTGSTVTGRLDGGAGIDTLTLRLDDRPVANGGAGGNNSGATTGTLANVVNFEALTVASGSWTLADAQAYAAGTTIATGATLALSAGLTGAIADNGWLVANGTGTVTLAGTITGSGTVEKGGIGTLILTGGNSYSGGTTLTAGTLDIATVGAAGTGAIAFTAGAQTLQLEAAAFNGGLFGNTITGYAADGDTIDVRGIGLAIASYNGGTGVLTLTGSSMASVTIGTGYGTFLFTTAADGAGGTAVTIAPSPVLAISDATVVEGNNGVVSLSFTVSLAQASVGAVSVDYATANGTAVAGADYVATTGTVTFAPGETSKTVVVPVIGDTVVEAAETLTVTLTNPAGGIIVDNQGTGTITNDDGVGAGSYYALAGGSFSQDWSNIGLITANDDWSRVPFIIGYLGDTNVGSPTGVDPRTLTGPALGQVDVIANLANTTSTSGGVGEFQIANPTIGLQGSGTGDNPSIVLYLDSTGRTGVHVHALLRDIDTTADDAAQPIVVQYRTNPTGDWINAPGGYFADVTTGGSATQVTAVDIDLPADANNAPTLEVRFMTTNAPSNDEWVGIDDILVSSVAGPANYSIADTAAYEGNSGTSPISFTVTRAGDASLAETVDYAVTFPDNPLSASAADFASPLTGRVTFAAGQTAATVTLQIAGDTMPEANEGFTVTLSNASAGGTFGDATATGTIVNDDATPPFVTIGDVTQVEGNAGTTAFTFTVTRTGGTGAFAVDYTTANGTATAGADFQATSGTLTFAAGDTTKTITVNVLGETRGEQAETFSVQLSNATNFALITDATGVGTITNDDPIPIYDIQGAGHASPFVNQAITTGGIVTAIIGNSFWIQDPLGDGRFETSDAVQVFIGAAPTGIAVGNTVTVTGTVTEFLPTAGALTVTEINTSLANVVVTGTAALPDAVLIGADGGILPPTNIIDDDRFQTYDPQNDGIDFYEALEGMRVTVQAPIVTGPSTVNNGGVRTTYIVASGGVGATNVTERGGIALTGDDAAPERIQIFGNTTLVPDSGVGDRLADVTGILTYFTFPELLPTQAVTVTLDNTPTQELSALRGDAEHLLVASFNIENADPGDPQGKFDAIATEVVNALARPDIIGLQEVQDADGAGNGANLSGQATADKVIAAIVAAGGPTYTYVEVMPDVAGTTGGEPGGNIRNGYLFNAARVTYVPNSALLIQDPAYANTRKPLVAQFVFNETTVTVVNLHSTSRGGSDAAFGATQPPVQAGDAARTAQAAAAKAYINNLQAADPNVHVVTLGDFNGYYYEAALSTFTNDGKLTNLYSLLPVAERYSYLFEGASQAFDNILVTNNLLPGTQFDVVHYNAEQPVQPITDHDQALASIFIALPNTAPTDLALDNAAVAENAPAGTLVGTITGTDREGGTLTFTLVDSAGGRFAIDAGTGRLTTTTPFDFEATTGATVTVRVTDPRGLSYDEAFAIAVTDVNEAPTALALGNATVAENAPAGTLVGTLAGTDADAGSTLRYSLVDTGGGRFAVDAATGRITTTAPLDYESVQSVSIAARVTDGGGLSRDGRFTVTVTNVNEAPTALTLSAATVAENGPAGTLVGTLAGTDPDAGATFTYALVDNGGGRFAVDAATGRVTTTAPLDYETVQSIAITARVTDQGGLARDQRFTVAVTNVNEAPANLALSASTVAENAAAGTLVGTASAADPDGEALRYTLSANPGGLFAIDAATGRLTTTASLDFEAAVTRPVTIRATDAAGLFVERAVSIAVTDVNEAPVRVTISNASIAENSAGGTVIGTLSGNDPDAGDSVTFIYASTDQRFRINGNQLVVAAGAVIDYEVETAINLQVTATDRAGLSVTSALVIAVTDVAESFIGTSGNDTITGDGGANVISGLAGDDTLFGAGGNDTIDGGDGNDVLNGGAGADRLTLGAGNDTVRALLSELLGDTITDFTAADRLVVQRSDLHRTDFSVSPSGVVTFAGGAVTLAAGTAGGDLMVAHQGNDSIITLNPYLATLGEGKAVAATAINGIVNQPYLAGDTSTSFTVRIEAQSQAKYANTLGVYEIDTATGAISDVRIIAANVKNAGGTITVTGVDVGHQLGFFLVQNGAKTLSSAVLGSNSLSLITDNGHLVLADGGKAVAGATTFFSHVAAANLDGQAHVLSGVADDGSGDLRIGFEDLLRSGKVSDNDFQDVVFSVHAVPQVHAITSAPALLPLEMVHTAVLHG